MDASNQLMATTTCWMSGLGTLVGKGFGFGLVLGRWLSGRVVFAADQVATGHGEMSVCFSGLKDVDSDWLGWLLKKGKV